MSRLGREMNLGALVIVILTPGAAWPGGPGRSERPASPSGSRDSMSAPRSQRESGPRRPGWQGRRVRHAASRTDLRSSTAVEAGCLRAQSASDSDGSSVTSAGSRNRPVALFQPVSRSRGARGGESGHSDASSTSRSTASQLASAVNSSDSAYRTFVAGHPPGPRGPGSAGPGAASGPGPAPIVVERRGLAIRAQAAPAPGSGASHPGLAGSSIGQPADAAVEGMELRGTFRRGGDPPAPQVAGEPSALAEALMRYNAAHPNRAPCKPPAGATSRETRIGTQSPPPEAQQLPAADPFHPNRFRCACGHRFSLSPPKYQSYMQSVRGGSTTGGRDYPVEYPVCPAPNCGALSNRHVQHDLGDD